MSLGVFKLQVDARRDFRLDQFGGELVLFVVDLQFGLPVELLVVLRLLAVSVDLNRPRLLMRSFQKQIQVEFVLVQLLQSRVQFDSLSFGVIHC